MNYDKKHDESEYTELVQRLGIGELDTNAERCYQLADIIMDYEEQLNILSVANTCSVSRDETGEKSQPEKKVTFLLKHIKKLRDEVRNKNKVIRSAYNDLTAEEIPANFKIVTAAQQLAVELRRQQELDKEFLKRMNQLFIDEGEAPPFKIA